MGSGSQWPPMMNVFSSRLWPTTRANVFGSLRNQEVREHLFELASRRMVDAGHERLRQVDNVIPLRVPRR
jgi:hypothetical protein